MKTVLFSLNASRSHTNLAIRLLKASLEKQGFSDVTLIERTEKERSFDTLSALVTENADVYGFSTYLWNVKAHTTLAENLKKLLPNAKIVFGGPEVSYNAEEILSKYMYTAKSPDPDMIIRTGGDFRVSNFLLWQGAYSEYVVLKTLWPDFGDRQIMKCVRKFYKRDRRFGGLGKGGKK